MLFWQEIKTPANLRHCRDSSKVKSLHLGPAMSPESPAPREPGIQMTGALPKIPIKWDATFSSCVYFSAYDVLNGFRCCPRNQQV